MNEPKPGRGEQMNYEDYIEQGLNGEAPLKLILRGSIQNSGNEKVGRGGVGGIRHIGQKTGGEQNKGDGC